MPQMSPMNWMILSVSFFFSLLILTGIQKSNKSMNNVHKNHIKILKWKW